MPEWGKFIYFDNRTNMECDNKIEKTFTFIDDSINFAYKINGLSTSFTKFGYN